MQYPDGTILFNMDDSTYWLVRSQPWLETQYQYYCLQIPDNAHVSLTQYGQYAPPVKVTTSVIGSIHQIKRLAYSSLDWEEAQTLLTQYAPYVWLAQGEKYFPVNVEWYFQHCCMGYEAGGIDGDPLILNVGQVNDANIARQSYGSATSHFAQNSQDPYARSSFYLSFPNASTVTPPTVSPCTAPVYACVVDRVDSSGLLYRDLLYAFFYSYDEAFAASHQADWEHIVVRLDPFTGNIMAIFYQTHGQHDTFSNWYYPPDAAPLHPIDNTVGQTYNAFQYYVDPTTQQTTTRCVVYSANGSHASYTSAAYFATPGGTTDATSKGTPWDTAQNVVVMDPAIMNWVMYSGLWGNPDQSGTFGNPPSGPGAQGWLTTLNPSSPEYHKVIDVSADPKGYTGQTNRVSADFSVVANVPIEWTISGVDAAKVAGVAFGLAQDRTHHNDIELINGVGNGDVLTLGTVSDLYITNLTYRDASGNSYSGSDVFGALGVKTFQIKADYRKLSSSKHSD
jgi:hypothetical protein